MAEINYDEDPGIQTITTAPRNPFMVGLVIRTGIVKTESDAYKVLLGVVVILSIIGFSLFLGSNNHPPAQTPSSPTWPGKTPPSQP